MADNNFEELLKSLHEVADNAETLAKAMPTKDGKKDDKAVQAAAVDAGAVNDPDGDDEEDDDGDGDGMVDATELVKSIMDRQNSGEEVLAKAIAGFTGALSKQNTLIKSLQAEVQALSGQGRGRKTMLTITEKPGLGDMAKSQTPEGGISHGELLAKANAAYTAGKLSGSELNTVDVCLRSGWGIDAGILNKVASA